MDKAYYTEKVNGIMQQVYAIYHSAKKKDIHFNESNYEWRLGVEVINDIANEVVLINAPDVPMQLYGIPVLRDYHNPGRLELWKNITND